MKMQLNENVESAVQEKRCVCFCFYFERELQTYSTGHNFKIIFLRLTLHLFLSTVYNKCNYLFLWTNLVLRVRKARLFF